MIRKHKFLIGLGGLFSGLVKHIMLFCGRRECYICKKSFPLYLPVFGEQWYKDQIGLYGRNSNFLDMTYNRWEFICPYCGSLDRTRLIMIYIYKGYQKRCNLKILYFAPNWAGLSFLKERMNAEVDTDDLYEEGVDFRYDVQNLTGIKDNTYDLLICSHILEHVPDDRKALKEIYRVLKKQGEALILVPLDLKRVWFDEQNGLTEKENWYKFGQFDHVRRYTDAMLKKRLKEAGFKCRIYNRDNVGEPLSKKNAFNKYIRVYRAQKR